MKIGLFVLLFYTAVFSQNFNISGIIKKSDSGEFLPDANLYIQEIENGTSSDKNGKFIFRDLSVGTYTLKVSYIGFETKEFKVVLNEDIIINS